MMTIGYLETILGIAVVILLIGVGALISSILNHRRLGENQRRLSETQRQLEDIKKSADHAVKNAKAAVQAADYFRIKQDAAYTAEHATPREVTIVNNMNEPVPVESVSRDDKA